MREGNKTRTQRRMERRHAVILLVLLLVASLASFIVGIFVGRHGGDEEMVAHQQIEEVVIEQVAPAPQPQPVPQRPAVEGSEAVPVDVVQEQQAELSFYDDLSKEPTVPAEPLGSGINLAPVAKAEPPIPLAEQPVVVKQAPVVKKQVAKVETVAKKVAEPIVIAPASSVMPKTAAAGTHAVQIGSFNASKDALALKKKMLAKGQPAYMVEADLGEKGLWYRVKIGPYAGSSTAQVAQQYLLKQEQIEGFVTRK